MHVMANGAYILGENVATTLIGSLGVFVQLFFLISGFGLCCGYYERIKNNQIPLNKFFNKRYLKIFPYFALLIAIDVLFTLTQNGGCATFYEAFANLTLFFGFLPNSNIEVVGVGWTLGVIFAFYIIFPFFVYLLWTKRRAWITFVIALVLNYACTHYFLADGNAVSCNLARWMCYFLAGGIIYLYKDNIQALINKKIYIRIAALIVVIGITVAWFFIPGTIGNFDISTLKTMIIFAGWLCYAISVKSVIFANSVTKFISSISFEIYLAHMLIFRVVERLGLVHIAGTGWSSYIITSLLVLVGVGVFAWCAKWCLEKLIKYISGAIEKFNQKKVLKNNQTTE